jgi:hypothetical protein
LGVKRGTWQTRSIPSGKLEEVCKLGVPGKLRLPGKLEVNARLKVPGKLGVKLEETALPGNLGVYGRRGEFLED